jgi:hypothetical protein
VKPTANEIRYANSFEVAFQYIRPTREWVVRGIGDLDVVVSKINLPRVIFNHDSYASMDFAPSMFQRTTMAALGDKTLTELENMPTEVGYVLITYTDDDYPWEV